MAEKQPSPQAAAAVLFDQMRSNYGQYEMGSENQLILIALADWRNEPTFVIPDGNQAVSEARRLDNELLLEIVRRDSRFKQILAKLRETQGEN